MSSHDKAEAFIEMLEESEPGLQEDDVNRADGVVDAQRFYMPDDGVATAHLCRSRVALSRGKPDDNLGAVVSVRTRIEEGKGVWESFRIIGYNGAGDTLAWVVEPE